MAFEGLTQRLQQAFGKVRGKGSLTEEDVKLVMLPLGEQRPVKIEHPADFNPIRHRHLPCQASFLDSSVIVSYRLRHVKPFRLTPIPKFLPPPAAARG